MRNTWCVYRHTVPDGRKYIGIAEMPVRVRWANGKLNMHKLTNNQYEAYMKMLRDKEDGRLLTPDGLRMICSANEYNPEKIGLHMLMVLENWNKVEV